MKTKWLLAPIVVATVSFAWAQDDKKPAQKGWIGWQVEEAREGLLVDLVFEGGPAAKAGFVAGDKIATVNGAAANMGRVLEAIKTTPVGGKITFERLKQDGSLETVTLVVQAPFGADALIARTLATGARALDALQRPDGLWPDSQDATRPGIASTALACAALAAVGSGESARLERGVNALVRKHGEDGGIADAESVADPQRVLANALFLVAVTRDPARRKRHAHGIETIREWLCKAQLSKDDERQGGWATRADGQRTDVALAAWSLEALAAAKLPPDRPEWGRAVRWLERCQNLDVRASDGPLRAREEAFRDGGFACAPTFSRAGAEPLGDTFVQRSHGTATADGARALLACGQKDRAEPALRWLAKNYTLERAPGFAEHDAAGWGGGLRFAWCASLARALDAARVDKIAGHSWTEEMPKVLFDLQDPQTGLFTGKGALAEESSPVVATSLALLALTSARDRRAARGSHELVAGKARPLAPFGRADGKGDVVERGRRLFQSAALGCTGCHSDTPSNGPSLVGVADRYLEWKKTREAAKEYLASHLRDPEKFPGTQTEKWPKGRMPRFGQAALSNEELDGLVEFLLSRTGTLPASEARTSSGGGARSPSADRGSELAHAKKCADCHKTEADAPSLKGYFDKFAKADGPTEAADRVREKLATHKDLPLTPEEIADLVEFLKTAK